MNINKPSLIEFEIYRKTVNYIPPEGSNSFYGIGNGNINILCISDDPNDIIFNLFTNIGTIKTGNGNFIISSNKDNPYKKMTVIANTSVMIDKSLTVDNGLLEVHGAISFEPNSVLNIVNGSTAIFYMDSTLNLLDISSINVDETSEVKIYGTINIDLVNIDVLSNERINIDSAAIINVRGIDLGKRAISLTDYETILRDEIINVNTQGESNSEYGRLGYNWVGGSPTKSSQIIKIILLWGEAVLGDFKLPVLGLQNKEIDDKQIISDILIKKGCTLYISNEFKGFTYLHPELYLGVVLGNTKRPAECVIEGTVIVDGSSSRITVDRGASIHLKEGAELYLQNGAYIRSTNNDKESKLFFIDGTLIIDSIDQINTFHSSNIVFGDNGKIKILNPDTGERKLLFTTPNGILNSDLYRLFRDEIDHIEYHISNNNGIGIDQYYEFYAKDMNKWFGDRRIEKAIHDGILVWHDGAFIEIYEDITPWANTSCTLLEASRLFKSFGSYDNEKLQEVVERLTYAGCGNITFRFIDGDKFSEVTLVLEKVKMTNVINKPMTDMYVLYTDNDGDLFIKDKVEKTIPKHIISERAKNIKLNNGKTEFQIP